ncbi:hypothetical protein J3Q64DRAFT_1700839 [Phycomyces blakesleeanus]|uniref:Alkyl hydroperoxide reductase subunit C/ Thiol specific antioxidant domain-containing protein n=2 Tax=Phycomyces blakesleeanus TaxID=4837 RepID=A0A167LLH0_PHYB8|nr:hypothetical protein PHYBLDRAFT_171450 [Phycomyces blakesleeanus NRRL 1555(-)]OAD70706.1 hypothetical protein PHYBLDRAFT_171450 [Phycomyces blakesleeanus NRRL 1555(-)]|eukprot:XP_018288746.1 hypothetical protein PHYBLDRAFT_171450 [Phycomyces blakesleeanus NRRL 1555(-)]
MSRPIIKILNKGIVFEHSKRLRTSSDDDTEEESLSPSISERFKRPCTEIYPQAPNFSCEAYYNNTIIPFQLSMPLKFSRGVVLFFYERDFMEQASVDINQIENNLAYFSSVQVLPIAVSVDTINNHKAFLDRPDVYGIIDPISFPLCKSAFIIDKEGFVMYKFKPRYVDKPVPYPMNLIFSKASLYINIITIIVSWLVEVSPLTLPHPVN